MGDIEEIGSKLAQDMPAVQDHTIAAEEERAAERAAALTDADGRPFDPAIHVAAEDGSPVVNAKGFIRKKSGRGSPKSKLGAPIVQAPPVKVGHQIAEAIFMLGRVIGGEEWAPRADVELGIDERAQMRDAWGRFAEEKGWSDVPPGLAVVIVTGAYVAPRFALPQTRSRARRVKEWFLYKVLKRAPRPDSGNNRERKNDTGETPLS